MESDQYLVTHIGVTNHGLAATGTELDYDENIPRVEKMAERRIPILSHEICQCAVYPDYREIPRFTGVTRARNLEVFRESLDQQAKPETVPGHPVYTFAKGIPCLPTHLSHGGIPGPYYIKILYD